MMIHKKIHLKAEKKFRHVYPQEIMALNLSQQMKAIVPNPNEREKRIEEAFAGFHDAEHYAQENNLYYSSRIEHWAAAAQLPPSMFSPDPAVTNANLKAKQLMGESLSASTQYSRDSKEISALKALKQAEALETGNVEGIHRPLHDAPAFILNPIVARIPRFRAPHGSVSSHFLPSRLEIARKSPIMEEIKYNALDEAKHPPRFRFPAENDPSKAPTPILVNDKRRFAHVANIPPAF